MGGIIQLLPDSVANQIAAGEVIQRPASAIKELLENAVDAKAGHVKLIIREAGKTLIQVIDDGTGMSETDARMSFERHATSKIKTANDLFSIRTLGFRGEALASIAAIAQVELKSRQKDQELGTLINIQGAKVTGQEVCACPVGTSISVKNLFFNVPARRKFLKSNTAETRHIVEEFFRVAMVNPEIEFSFYNKDKPIHLLPKSNLKNRIVNLFGKKYRERLIPLKQATEVIRISGFIGKPEYAKKTRGEQYFFVNNRFIRHPYLNHAVESAFKELIPEDAYPSYFIYLDIDPGSIDVNIHPTKTEVNFEDSHTIYALLRSCLKESLGKNNIVPSIDFGIENQPPFSTTNSNKQVNPPKVNINPSYNPFEQKPRDPLDNRGEASLKRDWEKLYKSSDLESNKEELSNQFPEANITADKTETNYAGMFQFGGRYIISKIKSGVLIVDQKRAHERVLYEKFLSILDKRNAVSQQQLFPQNVTFSPADAEIIKELLNDIRLIGFDISELGKNTFVIHGVPADIKGDDPKEMLEKVLENFKKNIEKLDLENQVNLAMSMAVQLSVKIGQILQPEEMSGLIDALFACQVPDRSPMGKPALAMLTPDEIELKFKSE